MNKSVWAVIGLVLIFVFVPQTANAAPSCQGPMDPCKMVQALLTLSQSTTLSWGSVSVSGAKNIFVYEDPALFAIRAGELDKLLTQAGSEIRIFTFTPQTFRTALKGAGWQEVPNQAKNDWGKRWEPRKDLKDNSCPPPPPPAAKQAPITLDGVPMEQMSDAELRARGLTATESVLPDTSGVVWPLPSTSTNWLMSEISSIGLFVLLVLGGGTLIFAVGRR